MNCIFCDKLCKNFNSKRQHEVRCKLNPDAIEIVSNFINYNEKVKSGEIERKITNQFTKAKELGLEKPIVKDSTRKKISENSKKYIWTEERKLEHSKIMSEVALNNPDVYGNKQKRNIIDYKGYKFDSLWELNVAKYFDLNGIKWIRPEVPIPYKWNDKWHLYYPDFYLVDFDKYIEVKGYETDRDKAKWSSVKNIIVIKQKEIKQIIDGNFVLVL